MQLMLVRHLWGFDGAPEILFPRIKTFGYNVIEAVLPTPENSQQFQTMLKAYDLSYIPQIFTTGSTVDEHIQSFREYMAQAVQFQPLLINCHSGKDHWTLDESLHFYEQALAIEAEAGIPVAHETHRGRAFFNPWVTARILERFPDLKLCCDYSHWVCVAERLLEDERDLDAIRASAQRCIHIHARVGYEEGPQVPDPRAPEYMRHLEAHEIWWNMIWDEQEKQGFKISTLTPEFGPPNYLHTLPFTQAPVANLEDICNWMAKRQQENFDLRSV